MTLGTLARSVHRAEIRSEEEEARKKELGSEKEGNHAKKARQQQLRG